MRVLVVHPWERQKMLHSSSYRPSRAVDREKVTYARACRLVERGEAEWIGSYLAYVPKFEIVVGTSGDVQHGKYTSVRWLRKWKP